MINRKATYLELEAHCHKLDKKLQLFCNKLERHHKDLRRKVKAQEKLDRENATKVKVARPTRQPGK